MNCIKEKKIYVKKKEKKRKPFLASVNSVRVVIANLRQPPESQREIVFSWLVSSTVVSTIHHLKAQEIMAMQKNEKRFFFCESRRRSSICVYPQTFIDIIYKRFVASSFSFHHFESGRMGTWE